MTPELDVQIRWMIRRDMPEVMQIEQTIADPHPEEEFMTWLRKRNCIGMVAEHKHAIAGFMIYELHRNRLVILQFGVAENMRRRGVGRQMMCRLRDKLSSQRRTEIHATIPETMLPAQMFFSEMGFRCVRVEREAFGEQDGYFFRYLAPRDVPQMERISQ